MRAIGLHSRARCLATFALGVILVALLAWWAADWLSSRPYFDGPRARPPVVGVAPLLVAVLMATTLGGADEELERSTAWPWRRLRVLLVLGLTAVGAVALALTGLWMPADYGAFELVRNTVACVGLVAASAVVVGAKLAWAPAFGYVSTVYVAAPKPPVPGMAWWTWPIQPSSAHLAWWTAGALFVVGVALYAARGARVARDREE